MLGCDMLRCDRMWHDVMRCRIPAASRKHGRDGHILRLLRCCIGYGSDQAQHLVRMKWPSYGSGDDVLLVQSPSVGHQRRMNHLNDLVHLPHLHHLHHLPHLHDLHHLHHLGLGDLIYLDPTQQPT